MAIKINLDNLINVDENIQVLDSSIIVLQSNKIKKSTKALSRTVNVDASLISKHIAKTWKDVAHSFNFLKEGLSLTKEEKEYCVFCGQRHNSTSLELLDSLHSYFENEYKEIQDEIKVIQDEINKFNVENTLNSIKTSLAKKNLSLELNYDHEIEELKKIKQHLNELLVVKYNNIQEKIDNSPFIEYNKRLDNIVEIIKEFKTNKFTEIDIEKQTNSIKLEIRRLRPIVRRNEIYYKNICGQYENL